jgi:hypothetical protein
MVSGAMASIEAVVNHLERGLDGGFAGDKDDTPPIVRQHARQIMARQAHVAHDVDIEEPLPLGIIDLRERLGAEDAEVLDQDIHLRLCLREMLDAFCYS